MLRRLPLSFAELVRTAVGLCLPDETNALLARREQPPRRLVPRDPDQRPVYITELGAFVGVHSGRLEVTLKKEKLASWRLLDVSQLAVFGRVQISTQALGSASPGVFPCCG